MANATGWTDRLRDRGFIDQWGFMLFAGAGFAGIVASKSLGIETIWVAIGAVLLMFVYALVIGRAGTGRRCSRGERSEHQPLGCLAPVRPAHRSPLD